MLRIFTTTFLIPLLFVIVSCSGIPMPTNEVPGKVLSKKVLSTESDKEEAIDEQLQEFGTAVILTANHTFSICALLSNCAPIAPNALAQYKVELRGGEVIEIFTDRGFFRIGDCVLVYKENNKNLMMLARNCRGI